MPLLPRSLKWRAILLTLLVTASSLIVAYFLNRSTVDGWWGDVELWMKEQRERQERIDRLKESDHPYLRALARGEFGRGSSADEWLAKHPPTECIRHDNYVTMIYGEGHLLCPHVIARDGKLVHAHCGAFTFLTEFFTFRNEGEQTAWSDSFKRWAQDDNATHAAVIGVAPLARGRDARDFPPPTGD
jgi:hypothetical protein